jgi:bacteriorhodopsin
MADAEAPTVTFPDDYPNSVRHFLLIGFLGMFIGSIVFFYMGISRKVNTVSHVLTFFIAAVASCSYYAMWAGLGVEYKTTDTTPRVIFWARYLDWVITLPVCANMIISAQISMSCCLPTKNLCTSLSSKLCFFCLH